MELKPYEVPAAIARHSFLLLMSAIFIVPFYIAIINVFKTRKDIFANPLGIPLGRLTLDNILRNLTRGTSTSASPTAWA